jgi:hypothetical protein
MDVNVQEFYNLKGRVDFGENFEGICEVFESWEFLREFGKFWVF